MAQSSSRRNLSRYFPPVPPSLRIGSEINRGAYGSVHEGKLDGRPVAVKKIHRLLLEAARCGKKEDLEKMVTDFEKECRLLEGLKHPHIVGFSGAFYDVQTQEPVLVMEKMKENLRDLLDREGQLSLRRQVQICSEIANGLEFLHTRSPPVAHRDLNDKNVMLSEEGVVKLGDLGQSKLKDNSVEYFITGQPGAVPFMPPEALREKPQYTEKIDMFSLGVLMLEICTGCFPSVKLAAIGVDLEIVRRREDLSKLADGHPLKPLILLCLKDDYKERPPANIVCSFLKNHVELHTTKQLLSDERKRCESSVKELHTTKQLLSDERKRCQSAVEELHTTKELLNDERKICQNAFKELDATKELLNNGLKRCESAIKELGATKELLNDGRKRCENAVKTQYYTSSFRDLHDHDPSQMPHGRVGGIPSQAKAKTAPIQLLRDTSQGDKGRKKYTVAVVGGTGRGKTTFCNFLFKEGHFRVNDPAESQYSGWEDLTSTTREAQHDVLEDPVAAVELHVIDMPGFLTTKNVTGEGHADRVKDGRTLLGEFSKALDFVKDGIDVLFVTLKTHARMSAEEEYLLEFLNRLRLWPYCILLFTHGSLAGENEKNRYDGLRKFIETDRCKVDCPVLTKMIEKTKRRFVIVESVKPGEDPHYHRSKLDEIYAAIDDVRKDAGSAVNQSWLKMAHNAWETHQI